MSDPVMDIVNKFKTERDARECAAAKAEKEAVSGSIGQLETIRDATSLPELSAAQLKQAQRSATEYIKKFQHNEKEANKAEKKYCPK